MSALTAKIARLLADNNGEVNGIVNGELFVEILNDLESAAGSPLIALAEDIDLNTAGTSHLNFSSGKSFQTHFGTHLVIKKKTGTFQNAGFSLDLGLYLIDDISLSGANQNSNLVYSLGRYDIPLSYTTDEQTVPNIIVSEGAENGQPLVVDILLYGFAY